MGLELSVLLSVCVYGAIQGLLTSVSATLAQVHKNLSETFYVFGGSVIALVMMDGFGPWSLKGVGAYALGRALYLMFSVKPLRPLRKWAWAISIAGIVGCLAELGRSSLGLLGGG